MYQSEEFKNRVPMADYIRDYKKGEGFLGYCEKFVGLDQIWSCPLYDFNPSICEKKCRYFYFIGKKITFEEELGTIEKKKKVNRANREDKEQERYKSWVCMEEREDLAKKIQELEKRYPGSIGVSAGSCHVCSRCTKSSGGCRYSDEIRYFIESLGVSTGRTTGDLLGIELLWRRQRLPGYFTLVSGLLTDEQSVEI